jgi:cellulose synthase/poly-beta-1,6-N-acetylglucosamine synthase-like glycosyltransferase
MFEMVRLGESNQDSTPFLEGSCMMWRLSSLDLSLLNVNSNADDAQIATAIRMSGLRSIFDEKASFTDVAPPTIEGQRRQKIRRAQGLQRVLKDQKKNPKISSSGRFKKIFSMQHYLHIYSPLLALGAGMSALSRWVMVSIAGMPTGMDAAIHASLGVLELFCLTSWLCVRQGLSLPLLGKIGTILTGLEYLLIAQYNSFRGQSSHLWQQHSDTREIISQKK